MELSKNTLKLLKWLKRHDQPRSAEALARDCPHYTYERLEVLISNGLITKALVGNPANDRTLDNCLVGMYRISEKGHAHLASLARHRIKRFCEWITIGISIAALFGVTAIKEWACKVWEIIRTLLP